MGSSDIERIVVAGLESRPGDLGDLDVAVDPWGCSSSPVQAGCGAGGGGSQMTTGMSRFERF